jgi:hypothetical protein
MDPALERLWLDVETERVRLRAQYAGYRTGPNLPELERRRTEEWVLAGAPVDNERAYLRWLHAQTP